MQEVFAYIISLGAAVMMPIIFSVLGLLLGIKPGKAVLSGLYVGVGFVGLSIITALLTSSLGPGLNEVVNIYGLKLKVFDMGWPAAASVAYNTAVGALIIPVCLGVNILLLLLRFTKTVNIDLWNYWHFAFIGAIVYFASGNLYLGFSAAIICYMITLVMADLTAKKFQNFYDNMDGISVPQPFCQGFVPFAVVINKLLDKIPGFDKLYIDADGMKKKFGLLGEPLFLGIIIGAGVGFFARYDFSHFFNFDTFGSVKSVGGASFMDNLPYVLGLGIKMGAVMELIPRITRLFIEGLMPISDATRKIIVKKFEGKIDLNIGMTPALVIGHPTTLVVSLLLIPVTLVLSVFLPGNEFLPLASLAGMFYLFPLILPITNGNVVKSFVIGLVSLVVGLYFVTDLAPSFTLAARDVYEATGDAAVDIPDGFSGGALDFASSIFSWGIFHSIYSLELIGNTLLVIFTGIALWYNRKLILAEEGVKDYYICAIKRAFDFKGRSRRTEYWTFTVINVFITQLIGLIGYRDNIYIYILFLIFNILILIPTIAVSVRRMHDVGKSGWFSLVPIYNIILCLKAGDVGRNKYGDDPKGANIEDN